MISARNSLFLIVTFFALSSCTYFEKDPIVIPVPEETEDLEAAFVTSPPNSINSPYWNSVSDFTLVTVSNQVVDQINAEEGVLNVNNMQEGLADFNEGEDPEVILRAAYDEDNIYILAEWKDINYNASRKNFLFNGPDDSDKPGQSADEWTSQRFDDNLIFKFSMGGGEQDIWHWSLALSEPMGYAMDKVNPGSGVENDAGEAMYQRNTDGDNRSGPKYEWNGEQQELTRAVGGFTILDPSFFLLNKMEFVGDVMNGEVLYIQECEDCHGVNGDGDGNFGVPLPLNGEGGLTRISRESIDVFAGSNEHTGNSHWTILNAGEKDDLVAFIRGLSGVPGHYLSEPTGSSADILASSSVQLARINPNSDNPGYRVLFIRSLDTGNADDVSFDLGQSMEYSFEILLSDSDDLNRIGSVSEVLIFK